MKKYNFYGKTLEEALNTALESLMCNQSEIYYNESEIKTGLFKSKKIELEVILKKDVIDEIKSFLTKIINLMGLDANFEIKQRDNATMITIFSNNNNILIGKQGRTINALSLILKQHLSNELNFKFNFILDVGDYKAKNQKRIEKLAKAMAKEVIKTKIPVKLDPMNSYERRLIHTILSDNDMITTQSIGEEPNRYVTIKLKEE